MDALADTGFVVSVVNATDKNHEKCVTIYKQQRTIYLQQTTFAEVGYFLTKAGGNILVANFLTGLPASKYRVIPLEESDIKRTADLLRQYADSRIDFVDTTIVAVAERLNITRILTIDRRDFHTVRPRHCDYFEILP